MPTANLAPLRPIDPRLLAASGWLRQLISLTLIGDMRLHSGMLYVAVVFNQGWVRTVLETGFVPILMLLDPRFAGPVGAVGFPSRPIED